MKAIWIFSVFSRNFLRFYVFSVVLYMFIFIGTVLVFCWNTSLHGIFGFLFLSVYLFFVITSLLFIGIFFLYIILFFSLILLYNGISIYFRLYKAIFDPGPNPKNIYKGQWVAQWQKAIWDQLNKYYFGEIDSLKKFPYILGGVTKDNLHTFIPKIFSVYHNIPKGLKPLNLFTIDVYIRNGDIDEGFFTYKYMGSFCLTYTYENKEMLRRYIWGCIKSMNIEGASVFYFYIRYQFINFNLIWAIKKVDYYVYQDLKIGESCYELLYSYPMNGTEDLYTSPYLSKIWSDLDKYDYYVSLTCDGKIGFTVGHEVSSKMLSSWLHKFNRHLYTCLCFEFKYISKKTLDPMTLSYYICRKLKSANDRK